MHRVIAVLILSLAWQFGAGRSCLAWTNPAAKNASVTVDSQAYTPVHDFDPKRDAAADIRAAIAEAQRTHKRILLDIGGNWCVYCAQLAQLFHADPPLLKLREASFITVYVYYGPGNHNPQALSKYGKFAGIPHYFILNSDGSLLHSEHLLDLRANGFYSPAKMKQFLTDWAPSPQTPH